MAVIRQLVRDLNLQLEIRVVPTVRDEHGLALSSRNARLSADEMTRALAIPRALRAAVAAHRARGRSRSRGPRGARRSARRLRGGRHLRRPADALVVAVRAGRTRLIDNVPLDHPDLAGLADRDAL